MLSDKHTVIAELGCANGIMLELLDDRMSQIHGNFTQYQIIGVDPAVSSVAAARMRTASRKHVSVLSGGAGSEHPAQMPLADDSTDLVLHTNCVYFWPSLRAGMRDVFRVLRSGGRHVFEMAQEDHIASIRDDSPDLFLNADHNEVVMAMEEAGFEQISVRRSSLVGGKAVLSDPEPISSMHGEGRGRAGSRGGEGGAGGDGDGGAHRRRGKGGKDRDRDSVSDLKTTTKMKMKTGAAAGEALSESMLEEQTLSVFSGVKPTKKG